MTKNEKIAHACLANAFLIHNYENTQKNIKLIGLFIMFFFTCFHNYVSHCKNKFVNITMLFVILVEGNSE